jgi:hypothetical protein
MRGRRGEARLARVLLRAALPTAGKAGDPVNA